MSWNEAAIGRNKKNIPKSITDIYVDRFIARLKEDNIPIRYVDEFGKIIVLPETPDQNS